MEKMGFENEHEMKKREIHRQWPLKIYFASVIVKEMEIKIILEIRRLARITKGSGIQCW